MFAHPRALFASILIGALVFGIPAHAQIGGLIKKKVPKVPGVAETQPAEAPKAAYCGGITPETLDGFLKGLEVERATREREIAAANARQAEADAAAKRRAQQTVDAMMKLAECKDAATAKDPRKKELDRLYQLAEEATAKGDEKANEKYSDQASALSNQMDAAASKACGVGDGTTVEECRNAAVAKDPRAKERDRLTQLSEEAAKKGDKAAGQSFAVQASALTTLIESDAAMACVANRSLGRAAGAEETAASKEAADRLRGAYDKGEDAGAKAANMSTDEYAKLKECTLGRIRTPKSTPTTPESEAAIDARRKELEKALTALEGDR